jgi:ABC-type proline/glycine betaine transport system ATPase subunit
VLVLEGGQVVQRGALPELEARPASEYVRRFLALTPAAAAPAP